MKADVYIDNDKIGEVNFSITDNSMGAIGGKLVSNNNYQKYKQTIQQHCNKKGISNIDDYNYKILLADNSELKPSGGIGITDLKAIEEIYVESAGLDVAAIEKIKAYEVNKNNIKL
jgi:hypothetical protein